MKDLKDNGKIETGGPFKDDCYFKLDGACRICWFQETMGDDGDLTVTDRRYVSKGVEYWDNNTNDMVDFYVISSHINIE